MGLGLRACGRRRCRVDVVAVRNGERDCVLDMRDRLGGVLSRGVLHRSERPRVASNGRKRLRPYRERAWESAHEKTYGHDHGHASRFTCFIRKLLPLSFVPRRFTICLNARS